MPVVSSDFLAAVLTNYRVIFESEFPAAEAVADWKKIVTEFTSAALTEVYTWLGTVPKMTEWVDERTLRGLAKSDFSIINKHYEATVEVDRDTYEDDRLGMIGPRIKQLTQEAARYLDKLVFGLLNVGHSTAAFDGTNFFADTRVIGASANIDNLLAMGCSASTTEVIAAIRAAVTAMRKFQDDRGRPMNLVPDTIVCPPDVEMLIREALLPSVAGTHRPEEAYVKNIITSPWLTSTVDWYMLCTSHAFKPIFVQTRKRPEFVSMDKPDDAAVFMRRRLLYGVDARWGVGVGDPRYAIKLEDT